MIDNIGFQIENYSFEEFEKLLVLADVDKINKRGNDCKWDWHNLRLEYYYSSKTLWVKNSIHIFYNSQIAKLGRVNHDNFTYSKLYSTISFLEDVLKRKSNTFNVLGKFEYGLNINTFHLKPFSNIIERYQSITTTASNPFYTYDNPSGKPFGKYCPFTNYKVKMYDKGKQLEIPRVNILRYEIVNNNLGQTRSVFNKNKVTVFDILDKKIWELLINNLLLIYDKIRIIPFQDSCSAEEYASCLCYSTPLIKEDYLKSLESKQPELKIIHDRLKNDLSNPHGKIRESIIENSNYLLNN